LVGAGARQPAATAGSDAGHSRAPAWSYPSCADSNFIVNTDQDVPVNALDHTHGVSFLKKGLYTGVSVIGSVSWRITVRPAGKRPVRVAIR
jgi:hypothetical protein